MFKDLIESDIDNVFFNSDEFAEKHTINKRILDVIVDNELLEKRIKKEFEGISIGDLMYFVKAKDYGLPPKIEDTQIFDGKMYRVSDITITDGIYEIVLQSAIN